MIDFALKLTREPYAMNAEDIQQLRTNGFSDEQVVDLVLITCTFNFMDRLADGLGVELGSEMQRLVEKNAGLG
jgi:alkylhydroperoxidase family enzyme